LWRKRFAVGGVAALPEDAPPLACASGQGGEDIGEDHSL